MKTEHYKKLLLAKQQELLESIARHEAEARDARVAEVEDEIDRTISDEAKAAGFQESTIEANTLKLVREALQRIEDGSYGKSLESGEPIEPARLEAVPWAQYTFKEQEKIDRQARDEQQLDAIS